MSDVNNIGDKYLVLDGWGHAFPAGEEVTLVDCVPVAIYGTFQHKDFPFHQSLRWVQVKCLNIIEENE